MKDINNFSIHYVTCIVGYPEHFTELKFFIGSRETVLFTPFGKKKVTQFSGLPPTSVSYLNVRSCAPSYCLLFLGPLKPRAFVYDLEILH